MNSQTTNSCQLPNVPLFWDELHPELYGGKSLTIEERFKKWNDSGILPSVVITDENHPPQPEEEDEDTSFEKFIENYDKNNLSPYNLKAELSSHMYEFAKENIKKFFDDNLKCITYGYTSSSFRSHILYRSDNGEIYIIHTWMGEANRAYYFTRSQMLEYFEDGDDVPDWEESANIKDQI